MFSKLVALCAFVAVSQAGLLPEPHYSHAEAVSSQSIVRHDEQPYHSAKLIAAPVAKLAVAAPVAYHAAPAPVVYHHAAPAPVAYHAAPAVHYAAPIAKVVAHHEEEISIVRHDQPQAVTHKLVSAPVAYHAAPAHVAYHAAPAPVTYHAAPAPIAYHAAPAAVHYAAPVAKVVAHHEEEIAHPKYEYTYSVADGHTGDNKSQQETRDGDVVKGSYSFHEADGSIRTVEYTADDHNGFNAVVHNNAPTNAPAVLKAAPVIVKTVPVYAAPTYYHY
ncbi:cuticle protein 8-like isoform X2 [Cydia splendana]|uniref:cuticle protein 8-like isoform X2 n=1 Tax=Cydia splendana TaxID=1100963 RepID=UPI00300D4DFF